QSGHRAMFLLHLGSGSLWAILYLLHQIISIRTKRFMKRNAKRAVVVFAFAVLLMGVFRSILSAEPAEPLEREAYLMGTSFDSILYETGREKGIRDSEAILKIIEETEQQLSTWRESSEVSQLNRQPLNTEMLMSPSLCELVQRLQRISSFTEGT